MKALKILWFAALVLSMGFAAKASTNLTLVSEGTNTISTLEVLPGQTASVLHGYLNGAFLRLDFPGGASVLYGYNYQGATPVLAKPLPVVTGPVKLTLFTGAFGGTGFCTIRLQDPVGEFSPAGTVVIPTDVEGPVEIVLESSADLVNWTRAQLGTYGASTEKRFFRVRAERN